MPTTLLTCVVDGVWAVDHRVGSRPLLGEVDHRVGTEGCDRFLHEGRVREIAHVDLHREVGKVLPTADALLKAHDGDQALDPHLEVVSPAGEVVDDTDPVSAS